MNYRTGNIETIYSGGGDRVPLKDGITMVQYKNSPCIVEYPSDNIPGYYVTTYEFEPAYDVFDT